MTSIIPQSLWSMVIVFHRTDDHVFFFRIALVLSIYNKQKKTVVLDNVEVHVVCTSLFQ